MAKLVKRNEVVMIIEREKEIDTSTEQGTGFMNGLNTIEENLALLSTVTESEIKAKAIDEYKNALLEKVEQFYYSINGEDVPLISHENLAELACELAEHFKKS